MQDVSLKCYFEHGASQKEKNKTSVASQFTRVDGSVFLFVMWNTPTE
jgi:hypothetical protein